MWCVRVGGAPLARCGRPEVGPLGVSGPRLARKGKVSRHLKLSPAAGDARPHPGLGPAVMGKLACHGRCRQTSNSSAVSGSCTARALRDVAAIALDEIRQHSRACSCFEGRRTNFA